MAETTVLKALQGYFNRDVDGKPIKPLAAFAAELKALSADEKRELAEGVVAITGDTLPA